MDSWVRVEKPCYGDCLCRVRDLGVLINIPMQKV